MATSDQTGESMHPGHHVRQNVLPKGMTVKRAAHLLGVGRPALSTFLNGKASLSQDMARRLARTFGADRDHLLNLQAQYDRRDEALRAPVVAGRHAPTLVEIRASRIAAWASELHARDQLPALLRRLVCATGVGLTCIDFPAFDNSQRHGADGKVETTTPTPWIPEGRTLWEFGCDGQPGSKANNDYTKRVKTVPPDERRNTTFVFVTPHNWTGKGAWAIKMAARGEWKDVRAYDAGDLEQWLEQSAETQIWFAERIGEPVHGYRSLDMGWSDWAEVSDPPLTPRLFSVANGSIDDFRRWLASPPGRPFVVAADSPDDARAFACHLVREAASETDEPGAGALVFDTPEAVRRFRLSNAAPRVAIIHNDGVEAELGEFYRHCHCIIVRPGNDVDRKPDIRLGLPGWQEFSNALVAMELSQDDVDRLARESGRSPAVLRRRLSEVPHIRAPDWAKAPTARKLLPAALVGAWRNDTLADRVIVRCLAGTDDDGEVENRVAELLALPDPPLWSTGSHRGVVSRIDALFGIAKFVTGSDLDNFFSIAERVLSEPDPALELPAGERWAASLHGKTRNHSPALRKGIRETLTLLSLHGDALFRGRLGTDLEARVSALVRELLSPLTTDRLLLHLDDLPAYAEAAPDMFLELIETDLRQSEPAVFSLMKPVESSPFGPGQQRIGLLWALECLGWKYLGRTSRILARLSVVPIDDNWVNRPIASLEAFYRSWLPQTSAPLDERVRSLRMLTERYPAVGWQVCIAQLKTGPKFATPSYRPHWSGDASGAGRSITPEEQRIRFRHEALDLVLSWPDHDHGTLGELVELFRDFGDEERSRVWTLIEDWAVTTPDDEARGAVRERIRRHALTRRSRLHGVSEEALDRARNVYGRLEPGDPVVRHHWLFSGSWIEPSADKNDENLDYDAHHERIDQLRHDAMKEIWRERGFEGVIALLADCGAPTVVGACLQAHIVDTEARADFLNRCLSVTGRSREMVELCVSGFLRAVGDDVRGALLGSTTKGEDASRTARLYRLAPVRGHTWSLLDRHSSEVRDLYWRKVMPDWIGHTESELTELLDRLLSVQRPGPAFFVARFNWAKIETSRLKRLLLEVGTVNAEPSDLYVPEAHEISNAFSELNSREGIDRDEMVRLEFMYFPVLDYSEYGIPNLERRIAESPIDFVRILALRFDERDDDCQDPPEWRIEDPEKRRGLATSAYGLLERSSRIPGTVEDGTVDEEELQRWIAETRRLCAEFGRAGVGDEYIGRLLSRAPSGEDGIQPSLVVSRALEAIGSSEARSGFAIGIVNGRGVTVRSVGEGGKQEGELVRQYRNWARQRSPEFPFVGSILEYIAADYEHWAQWEDEQAQVQQRLGC